MGAMATVMSAAHGSAEQVTEPYTTVPIIMRWFLIETVYTIKKLLKLVEAVRTNGTAGNEP